MMVKALAKALRLEKAPTGTQGLDEITAGGLSKGRHRMEKKALPKTLKDEESLCADEGETWELTLYVAGHTAKSITAFANLKKICEENLAGKYHIEVIDLVVNPQLGRGDQILAMPTLVRKLPQPLKKIIGDLSNTVRVLVGLDLRPRSESQGIILPASGENGP